MTSKVSKQHKVSCLIDSNQYSISANNSGEYDPKRLAYTWKLVD